MSVQELDVTPVLTHSTSPKVTTGRLPKMLLATQQLGLGWMLATSQV